VLKCGFKAIAMILPVVLLFGRKRKLQGDRENCVMWSFTILCSSPNITVFRAIRSSIRYCVEDEECIGALVVKTEGKSHLEGLVISGRIILKCVKEIRWEGRDWSNLARARCKRQAFAILVNELPDSVK